jgi:hypothetical protein
MMASLEELRMLREYRTPIMMRYANGVLVHIFSVLVGPFFAHYCDRGGRCAAGHLVAGIYVVIVMLLWVQAGGGRAPTSERASSLSKPFLLLKDSKRFWGPDGLAGINEAPIAHDLVIRQTQVQHRGGPGAAFRRRRPRRCVRGCSAADSPSHTRTNASPLPTRALLRAAPVHPLK